MTKGESGTARTAGCVHHTDKSLKPQVLGTGDTTQQDSLLTRPPLAGTEVAEFPNTQEQNSDEEIEGFPE